MLPICLPEERAGAHCSSSFAYASNHWELSLGLVLSVRGETAEAGSALSLLWTLGKAFWDRFSTKTLPRKEKLRNFMAYERAEKHKGARGGIEDNYEVKFESDASKCTADEFLTDKVSGRSSVS